MSSTSAQDRRWLVRLYRIALLAGLAFPWCFTLVPIEARSWNLLWLPVVTSAEVLCLAYTALFIRILIHECGHWFFGWLVGIRIRDFAIGTDSDPLRFKWLGIRFSFGTWLRWGYVREIPAQANLRFDKQLIFLAGGVIAEILLLATLFWLGPPQPSLDSLAHAFSTLRELLLLCGAVGIWGSLWPRQFEIEGRPTANDALRIRQAWQNRGKADEQWREIEWADEVNALSQSGKHAEAAATVERMLQSRPNHVAWHTALAQLSAAAKDYDRAFLAHHAAIQHSQPGSTQHHLAIDSAATLALQVGRNEELVRLRPLVEQAVQSTPQPTMMGTLGSLLIELGETEAGVTPLNRCLTESEADHDRAIANAYLAKAALRLGRKPRARELLGFAQSKGAAQPLVQRLRKELAPELEPAGEHPAGRPPTG